jgi:multidrug efflux pump subunit AcrB
MPTFMGLTLLAGIAAKNGILLVHSIQVALEQGAGLREATYRRWSCAPAPS